MSIFDEVIPVGGIAYEFVKSFLEALLSGIAKGGGVLDYDPYTT